MIIYRNGQTHKTFTKIWNNANSFKADVSASPLSVLSDESLTKLYYMLYARYGNNCIINDDETQFKFKVYTIIYEYGPTWETRLELQNKLRNLTESEIMKSAKQIYNHASNGGSGVLTDNLEEQLYIDSQNVNSYVKGKLNAYTEQYNSLITDVTESFLSKFSKCFRMVVDDFTAPYYCK